MTDVPDAAVQIARGALPHMGSMAGYTAKLVVAALHERGWLHDPAEVLTALGAGPGEDPVSAASFVREAADAFAARVTALEAELAAAESTIAALEDPGLRAALTTPTSGDYGPVPDPRKD